MLGPAAELHRDRSCVGPVFDRDYPATRVRTVVVAGALHGADRGVRYLVGHGHRHIAIPVDPPRQVRRYRSPPVHTNNVIVAAAGTMNRGDVMLGR